MADAEQSSQQTGRQTNQINRIDDQTGNQTLQTEQVLWTIPELMERYGIGKELVYKRMAYLKIQPEKAGKYTYLDNEQLIYMDGLHDHIQRTGKMILMQKLRGVLT